MLADGEIEDARWCARSIATVVRTAVMMPALGPRPSAMRPSPGNELVQVTAPAHGAQRATWSGAALVQVPLPFPPTTEL